jgi:hypothetical protein
MALCKGILVKDFPKGGPNAAMLPFEEKAGWFHLPIRCDRAAKDGGLCLRCQEKQERTQEKVRSIQGTTMPGMLPAVLNGVVGEPWPFWSRLYDSSWFRLKLAAGCKLSDVTMARAKKAVAEALGEAAATQPAPAPMPEGAKATRGRKKKVETTTEQAVAPAAPAATKKPGRPKKAVAASAAVLNPLQQSVLSFTNAPETAAPPPPPPPTTTPKKRAPKGTGKGVAAGAPAAAAAAPDPAAGPVALLKSDAMPEPVEDVVRVSVRSKEIDGRKCFVDSQKGKVYDLKYRYLGRWDTAADKIVPFPDSDAE